MKAKESTFKSVDLEPLTTKRTERIKRLTGRRIASLKRQPNIGMNVTVRFRESTISESQAFKHAVLEGSHRCGPSHTATQRKERQFSNQDVATLQRLEPAIIAFIAASPENATLYAYDPIAALRRLEKPLDNTLLIKLRDLSELTCSDAEQLPGVRIGRMKIEVEEKKSRRPGEKDLPASELKK